MSDEQKSPVIPVAKATAEHIAKNPWDYGFHWLWEPISYVKSGSKVLLRKEAPRIAIRPDQLATFIASFGSKVVSDSLNGTSIDVKCEQIDRTMILRDHSVPSLAVQIRLVDSILLGNVTRVAGTRTYFVGSDGKNYTSAEAAQRAAENAAKIADLERVQQFLAEAAERGVDSVLARDMARMMFPTVFEGLDKIEAERKAAEEEPLSDGLDQQDEDEDLNEEEQETREDEERETD